MSWLAALDKALGVLTPRRAVVAHDHKQFAGFFGRGFHFQRFFGADRVGLFAKHIFARLESGDRYARMPVIGCADIDRVDIFIGDELPKIGVDFRPGEEIVPAFDGPVFKDVAKSGYFNPFIF